MKKVLLITAAIFVMGSCLSYAEDLTDEKKDDAAKADVAAVHKMHKGKASYMKGMMMKCMSEKKIVATTDGGVVVLIANKLIKYDKNLNLVKEAEIKMDMEAMMKKMKEHKGMMEKCCGEDADSMEKDVKEEVN